MGHGVTKTIFFSAVESYFLGPKTFREARDYNDLEIQKRWSRRTLDVETEFLEGDIEEEFFIKLKLPTGYEKVLGDLGPDFKDILDG